MESEVFTKQMAVLGLLISNKDLSINEICDKAGVSRRTFFRYVESYRAAGFEIVSQNNIFSVSIDSPFINKITSAMLFTEDEVNFIYDAIKACGPEDSVGLSLKRKFRRVYGISFDQLEKDSKIANNKLSKINDAISRKKMVILEKYYSPHSQTESDRLVEPYKVLSSRGEVRCYELSSAMCKTFKVSRIKRVHILEDKNWEFASAHKHYYTDIFGFSGETQIRIKLRLGFLSHQILMEEYSVPEHFFHKDGEKHWIYYCNACNFLGIGRFVMGLANDIDVIDNDDFKAYLKDNIMKMMHNIEEKH